MRVFSGDRLDRVEESLAMQRVGDEVRQLRERRRMTLRGLAERIGVSAPFLSDVEHGRRRLPYVPQVEDLLGVKRGHFASVAGVCACCGGTGLSPARGGEGGE